MNQVRPLLAVVAAALTLAACEGTGSITDPAFRSDKAAPAAHAGSGLHADNGGWVGSGYDLAVCENGGTYGSGYDTCTASLAADNTGTLGSGYGPAIFEAPGKPGVRHRPFQGPKPVPPTAAGSAHPAGDCVQDNTGTLGSGYNFCPQS